MNSLKSILVSLVIILGLIIFGCSKSATTSRSTGGSTAVFTLGGAPGNCTGFTLAGAYTVGTALTSSNTVTFQVIVTTAGDYSISTATVNGVKFSAAGTFSSTGAQTVTLTGSGTPVAAVASSYSVTAGSGSCSFSVTPIGGGGGTAVFTLGVSSGNCTGFTLGAGTYVQGTTLTATNTVSLTVNVTTAGTYSITTPTVNGISFGNTGTFSSTGTQTVTLTGTGTPIAGGTFNYSVTAGSSTCAFSIASLISVQLNACDDSANWEISGGQAKGVQTTGQKEGTGWLEADWVSGIDYLHFIFRDPISLNPGLTVNNGELRFWLYISDVSQFSLGGANGTGQVELTSDGQSDFHEYNWPTDSIIHTCQNGWNEVKLKFNTASIAGVAPDLTHLNFFRIYGWSTGLVHPTIQYGLDDIRLQQY